jgi:putative chitinase
MKLSTSDLVAWGVSESNANKYISWINIYSDQFEVNTPDRILAFWSNVLHESGNFKYVKEIADGSQYEMRKDLGNTQPGDGKRFAGKSLAQITGRYNYTAFNLWCRKKFPNFTTNFVANPELLEEPKWAVLGAFWFWETNRLASYADKRMFKEVASIWNTGRTDSKKINGLEDRLLKQEKIEKWLTKLLAG